MRSGEMRGLKYTDIDKKKNVVLKTILGHSSLAMTMDLYSHVMEDVKSDEMEKSVMHFKAGGQK